MNKVWVTRIVIAAVKGDEPFEMIVRNDCLSFQYIRQSIADYFREVGGDKKILTILDNWKCPETMDTGYYAVRVAGVGIGTITMTRDEMPCAYISKVILRKKTFAVHIWADQWTYCWSLPFDVEGGHDVHERAFDTLRCSQPVGIHQPYADHLKQIASQMPKNSLSGEITYAGVKIGDFKIEETS